MLRPLAFVAMRQQHHQTAHAKPFDFTTCNKLIDDDLSTIGEISKLSFPYRQSLWRRHGISIFETKNAHFRQRAVVDVQKRRLIIG